MYSTRRVSYSQVSMYLHTSLHMRPSPVDILPMGCAMQTKYLRLSKLPHVRQFGGGKKTCQLTQNTGTDLTCMNLCLLL